MMNFASKSILFAFISLSTLTSASSTMFNPIERMHEQELGMVRGRSRADHAKKRARRIHEKEFLSRQQQKSRHLDDIEWNPFGSTEIIEVMEAPSDRVTTEVEDQLNMSIHMPIFLGTPSQEFSMIIDTASDWIWIQS